MRAINIQVQTQLEPSLDAARVRSILDDLAHLSPLVDSFTCNEKADVSGFIVFTYETNDLQTFWTLMKERVLSDRDVGEKVKSCSTIVATRGDSEGEGVWKDYVLLQHFDPSIETESLG